MPAKVPKMMARFLLPRMDMMPRDLTAVALALALALALTQAACAADAALPATDGAFAEGPPLLSGAAKADGLDVPAYRPLPTGADLEAPLEVLFAPDDPTVTLELTLIDAVIARRAEDPAAYAEGANPFRIRYAVYNLRNPHIVGRLADAADAGVDVQILIEADQLDPARDWNTGDEALVARGFELAPSHRDLDDQGRRTADLVGIVGSGLMHLKTRLYDAPGWRAGLSGSMNPGDHAVHNEETLHLIGDAALLARYHSAFEAVLRGAKPANAWDDAAATNVLFTPAGSGPRALDKVFQWLAEEDEQIVLMVYSLRDLKPPSGGPTLVQLLGDKVAAGVEVVVITDRKQSDGVDADGHKVAWDDTADDRLREAGVTVYEAVNRATPYTAMHHKVAVLGRTHLRVITDAANWTKAGLGSGGTKARNVESALFIDSHALDGGRLGARYLAQALRVLERYAHQSAAADGEPPFQALSERLTGHAGWPTWPVAFTAHEAYTDWGEGVGVVGDTPELGMWSLRSGGVSLLTDGDSYPTWTSWEPLTLPLGAAFRWKLVIERGGQIATWERGADREAVAMPAALQPGRTLSLEGTFRD